jgi:hypothetical protein
MRRIKEGLISKIQDPVNRPYLCGTLRERRGGGLEEQQLGHR